MGKRASNNTEGESLHKKRKNTPTINHDQLEQEGEAEGEAQGQGEDLFVLDSNPSLVPLESAYLLIRDTPLQEQSTLSQREQEEMLIFAREIGVHESDESNDEEEEEEQEGEEEEGVAEVVESKIYDDPYKLEQAIQGKITDDSAAKVD